MGRILAGKHDGVYLLKLEGDVRLNLCTAIDQYINKMLNDAQFKSVLIDLTAAIGVDSTTLGLMAKLSIQTQKRHQIVPALFCDNPKLLRVLRSMGFEDVFRITAAPPSDNAELAELPMVITSEAAAREQVLDAHRTLMRLNEGNRLAFKDLVATLEAEEPQPQPKREIKPPAAVNGRQSR